MDRAKGYVKEIVQKCWDNNIYPIITTLLPRRDCVLHTVHYDRKLHSECSFIAGIL